MLELEADIRVLNAVNISNVYLLRDKRGRNFLIDTGDMGERVLLRWNLWRWGIRNPGDLTAVLLTHHHRDHAGNAAWVRKTFGCPVVCHAADAPFLEGTAPPPPLSGRPMGLFYRVACGLQDLQPAICPIDETFQRGPWKYGFHIYPAPGHTDGQSMIYHQPTQTLFSGDAILVGYPPLRIGQKLRLAMAEYSPNVNMCHEATLRFIRRMPEVQRLCPGHGPMLTEQATLKIRALLEPPRPPRKEKVKLLPEWLERGVQILPEHIGPISLRPA